MALSTGGLAGIILFLLVLHVGALVGYYVFLQRNGRSPISIPIDESKYPLMRWIILGLLALSWVFSVAATASCTFLKIDLGREGDVGVGFNAYEDPIEGCTAFVTSDNRNNPAFTFAVFNCLLTSVGVIGMVLMQFVLTSGRKRAWLVLKILMYISTWCCLFSFYIQESLTCDFFDCSLGGAGVTQVFNVIFLIILCILMFLVPYGDDNALGTNENSKALADDDGNFSQRVEEAPTPKETQTETHLPDGSIERQVETINPDGSKTITTTIEKAPSEDTGDNDFIDVGDDDMSDDEAPERQE